MKVSVKKSPKKDKKWRAVFENGKYVDFGQRGYSDLTLHKNPLRMRLYVGRHGGNIPQSTLNLTDPRKIINKMKLVLKSGKEDWSRRGVHSAGFWSRWLLWSEPDMKNAVRLIRNKFNLDLTLI